MADEEKPFEATPSRIKRAKREGNIARSAEIGTVANFGVGTLATFAVVPGIAQVVQRWYERLAADPTASAPDLAARLALYTAVPFLAAGTAGIAVTLAQSGGLRVTPLKVSFARMKPVDNVKRMFAGEALVAAGRALLAFTAAIAVIVPTAHLVFVRGTGSSSIGALGALASFGTARMMASALGVALVFSVFDYVLVRRRWLKKLRMSLYELKQENKENEGDPKLRGRRRQRHRALIASARTLDRAAFVVANPTHIAVALEYAPPAISVPRVVLMAAEAEALHVRTAAADRGIPVVENVALARELWATATIGRSIPRESFVAVAEIVNALFRKSERTA